MNGLPFDALGEDIDGNLIYGCPILNYSTLGIHKGYTELIGAFSGCGKSSFILAERVMPIIYHGEKVALIANEMSIEDDKDIILPMILAYHFKYFKLTRKHLKQGRINDEQREMIKKAQKYYREHYYNKLFFVENIVGEDSVWRFDIYHALYLIQKRENIDNLMPFIEAFNHGNTIFFPKEEENRILKEKLKIANENIQELVYKIESIKQSN